MKHALTVQSPVFRVGTAILFLATILCPSVEARQARSPNPVLAGIHKLFIKGNSEAATAARKRYLIPINQVMNRPCFRLVGNEAIADGTLDIAQVTAPDGTVTVSGTLTDHQSDLVWSDSKKGAEPVLISPAKDAANSLMYGFEGEVCGVPPLIELSRVRKIYVSPEDFANVTWESTCITFGKRPIDADAVLMLTGTVGRKGRPVWALFDPKNNDHIPGWQTDSFKGLADLERAVGCH